MEAEPAVDRVRLWLTGDTADLVLRFLVILTLVFGVYMYTGYRDLAACVARYNNQAAAADAARSDAAKKDWAASDGLWFAIDEARRLPPAEAKARSEAAFDNYVKSRRETNEARAKNPPPPPPSELCDR